MSVGRAAHMCVFIEKPACPDIPDRISSRHTRTQQFGIIDFVHFAKLFDITHTNRLTT